MKDVNVSLIFRQHSIMYNHCIYFVFASEQFYSNINHDEIATAARLKTSSGKFTQVNH